jgi:hypothetical protein
MLAACRDAVAQAGVPMRSTIGFTTRMMDSMVSTA